MDLLLRGGRVIDTSGEAAGGGSGRAVLDAACDVLVRDGRIVEIGRGLAAPSGVRELDLAGKLVCAGLVDLHVHFREPGHEYKEDIASGSATAAAGGFTTVCCMPNTKPVNDCRAVTDLIVRRAREAGLCRVRPVGAISRGLAGEALAEIGEMRDAGIVAVSDDGMPVMNAGLMRRALEYARTFDLPVVQHAEDLDLAEGGAMNEGEVATRIGVRSQPAQAESVMVARDIELVSWTGARYHVAHISAARSVDLVREAKRRGLPVSCEVTPHHFALTDEACASYDTHAKCMPPLRTQADLDAIKEGMADGTIDCIATDHAPHSEVEKEIEFELAAPGMIGLETAVPLTLGLVREGVIDLVRAVHMLTAAPARLFSMDREGVGALAAGRVADLCVIDPERELQVDRTASRSKSYNTPFHGQAMRGVAVLTLLGGRVVYDREEMLS
ncbi:dihydroorotase [Haliangium ochraceum]|uniref:Dihydroorotase n=1 Tax=Haliangium ochraceum (strain DSM 14365 / JCM 11303 / SMP-2) TaxID=502025 RepID=D0LI68_HALO1|nr:dihydroorotase [Haliangium ochraceum]ACY16447.1 dihydroorotase, multifunctional complex type [Haliangium ochraceum DSM 14365]